MTAIKPVPEIPLEEDELGPAMRALPPRMRAFVFHYVNNGGKASRAIVSAAYSDSSPNVINVKAAQLMADERVQKAIQEHSWKMLSSLTPMALNAYETILSTPMHKDYARIASEVLDRTGFRLPTVHHVKVEKEPTGAELLADVRALCTEMGLNAEAMLAGLMRKRLPLLTTPGPVVTDAEFSEHSSDGLEDILK